MRPGDRGRLRTCSLPLSGAVHARPQAGGRLADSLTQERMARRTTLQEQARYQFLDGTREAAGARNFKIRSMNSSNGELQWLLLALQYCYLVIPRQAPTGQTEDGTREAGNLGLGAPRGLRHLASRAVRRDEADGTARTRTRSSTGAAVDLP